MGHLWEICYHPQFCFLILIRSHACTNCAHAKKQKQNKKQIKKKSTSPLGGTLPSLVKTNLDGTLVPMAFPSKMPWESGWALRSNGRDCYRWQQRWLLRSSLFALLYWGETVRRFVTLMLAKRGWPLFRGFTVLVFIFNWYLILKFSQLL